MSLCVFSQACAEFLELAQTQEKRWQKTLQLERQRRVTLEETVEALAKQHNTLERACRKSTGAILADMPGSELSRDSDEEEEEEEVEEEDDENAEFFDAIAEHPEGFTIPVSKSHESLQSTSSETSMELENASSSFNSKQEVVSDAAASETADELLFTTGKSETSTGDEPNVGSHNKIVAAPFTVKGSFGVTVTVSINIFIVLLSVASKL